ncbi:MAG: PhoH family protein [Erysipelotrichaceae bacterium]|nr:PhoH family protein [Erysipelotrichaceae bacterium]
MNLIGSSDRNLRILGECAGKEISYRNGVFIIADADEEEAEMIRRVLETLLQLVRRNKPVLDQDVIYAYRQIGKNEEVDYEEMTKQVIGRTMSGKAIAPKTRGQLAFVRAMEDNAIVFAIGPAGTGKTYLAVVKAVSALKKGDVKRIVLTRPAVEAGENLGFLPGDLKEKVDPYLTPLYDALHDMLGIEQTEKLMERGTIEVAPLAYMRGRTLNDAYVILDEAQNTTTAQMKMFLTRLGFHSRMVITGDITQIDLYNTASGLVEAARILQGMRDIAVLELTADDVVRHPLVQKIIERYSQENNKLGGKKK